MFSLFPKACAAFLPFECYTRQYQSEKSDFSTAWIMCLKIFFLSRPGLDLPPLFPQGQVQPLLCQSVPRYSVKSVPQKSIPHHNNLPGYWVSSVSQLREAYITMICNMPPFVSHYQKIAVQSKSFPQHNLLLAWNVPLSTACDSAKLCVPHRYWAKHKRSLSMQSIIEPPNNVSYLAKWEEIYLRSHQLWWQPFTFPFTRYGGVPLESHRGQGVRLMACISLYVNVQRHICM